MKPLELPPAPDLPEDPEYFGNPYGTNIYRNPTEIPDEGIVFPPGGHLHIGADLESGPLTELQQQEVAACQKFLCAYGFVEYDDVFRNPCETRFRYVYRPGDNIREAGFRVGGPAAYNKQS